MKKLSRGGSSRAERTRERILLYSARLFRERGIRKVTVDEICAGMGLSKRTFYKYFRGRDGLVEEVVNRMTSDALRSARENLRAGGPAEEVLREHCRLVSDLLETHASPLMLADVQAVMPELWLKIETLRREITGMLIETMRRGQAEGGIRSEIRADRLGKVIQGLIDAVANPAFALANGLSLDQVSRALASIVLNGILVPGPPQRRRGRGKKGTGR